MEVCGQAKVGTPCQFAAQSNPLTLIDGLALGTEAGTCLQGDASLFCCKNMAHGAESFQEINA